MNQENKPEKPLEAKTDASDDIKAFEESLKFRYHKAPQPIPINIKDKSSTDTDPPDAA